jgi:molecular chaperone DnaK (HSP70)
MLVRSKSQVDQVILVGRPASPRFRMFSEYFGGKEPTRESNPDEAVV